jgi:glutathione S-transferase
MSPIRVLGRLSSINVRKVMWTAAVLGLPVQREEWGAGFRSPTEPEFLALNPNALVPVLVDGPTVLWESNTICRYLAARQGDTQLLPSRPSERALVEQWMDWQAGELNNSWRTAFMALHRGVPTPADAVQQGADRWNQHMRLLDDQLHRTGAYVTGPDFTLADVVLGLSAQRWRATPIRHAELSAVAAYLQRLGTQPGFSEFVDNGMP